MCKGSDGRQRLFSYLCVLVSVARRCRSVWNLACSESSSRISGFLTWCHRAQHISLSTCRKQLRRDFWWWDCQTVVDSGVARALRSGRAVGIDGYETKEETPQTLLLMHSCFRLFASLFPPLFFFLMLFSQFLCCFLIVFFCYFPVVFFAIFSLCFSSFLSVFFLIIHVLFVLFSDVTVFSIFFILTTSCVFFVHYIFSPLHFFVQPLHFLSTPYSCIIVVSRCFFWFSLSLVFVWVVSFVFCFVFSFFCKRLLVSFVFFLFCLLCWCRCTL